MLKNFIEKLKFADTGKDATIRVHKDGDFNVDVDPENYSNFMDENSEQPEAEEIEKDTFYRILRISLLATGFCFRRYTPDKILSIDQIIRFLFAVAYLILTTYMILFMGLAFVGAGKPYQRTDEGDRTRSLTCWLFYTLVTMYVLVYREFRHQNQKILEIVFRYRSSFYRALRFQRLFQLLFILFPLVWLLRFIGLLVGLIGDAGRPVLQRFLTFELFTVPFHKNFGSFLCVVISFHMFLIMFIQIIFFAFVQFPLVYYLDRVHLDLERMGRVGARKAIEYYAGYRQLLLDVYKIHRYLQLYRLLTQYLCAIIAVVDLYTFPKAAATHRWHDYYLLFVDLGMIALVALIAVYPTAAILERLRVIKNIMYFNQQMWIPYDQERYELAKLYSEMPIVIIGEITLTGYEYVFKPVLLGIAGVVVILLISFNILDVAMLVNAVS